MSPLLRHIPQKADIDLSIPYFSCEDLNQLHRLEDYTTQVKAKCQAALEIAHQEANHLRKQARIEAYQDVKSAFFDAIQKIENYRCDLEGNLQKIVMQMLGDALESFSLQTDQWNQLNHAVTQMAKTQSNRFAIKWLVCNGQSDGLQQAIANSRIAGHLAQLNVVETSEIKASEVALEFPGGARISVDAAEFVENLIESTRKWHDE
ncbi:hypothetical protein NQT62_03690 [Limnobacter humi]|uniref:HrpE/YscL family type III secretion apparatus protein n=1 Tax=Limnobacter humi TaxID=1778671 RepID=A0ABT1WDE7_9BURK|nr:hypothetical protein [Limnobacter humi]MCQ8895543.1 hypothetical protein [Limnobacter humi]